MDSESKAKYYTEYMDRCHFLGIEPQFEDFNLSIIGSKHPQCSLMKWTSTDEIAVIPEFIDYIYKDAFKNSCVKEVDFRYAKNLRSIEGLFNEKAGLEVVHLGEYLKTIGDYTFAKTSIKELNLGSEIQSIGQCAFYHCTNLKKINFAKQGKLDKIGVKAFMLSGIQNLNLPCSIERIHARAFSYCNDLLSVQLKGKLIHLSKSVFEGCGSLVEVNAGGAKSLYNIPEYTFYNCGKLERVDLDNMIKSVAECVFVGCKSLKEVTGVTIEKIHFTNKLWLPDNLELV